MTDQREPGLRQRKQAATALTIERSAVALVQEHGFQAVTVDMICAASGVSQRTFFNYFKTKDQAILGPNPAGWMNGAYGSSWPRTHRICWLESWTSWRPSLPWAPRTGPWQQTGWALSAAPRP